MADEWGNTIMACTQVSVANKINAFLTEWVPSFDQRLLYTVAASVLVLMGKPSDSSDMVTEIVLAVTTTTILESVTSRSDAAAPIFLAQSCIILILGEVFNGKFIGQIAQKFSGNIKYIFANTVSQYIIRAAGPALKVTSAVTFMYARSLSQCSLSQALGMAGLNILKVMLLSSIPPILKLPSIAAIVCFANPLQGKGLGASALFGFALYQASQSLQDQLLEYMGIAQAIFTAAVLTLCAPSPVFRALGKITVSSLCTDAFFRAVQEASDTDPFLCLTGLLVVLKTALTLLEKYNIQ